MARRYVHVACPKGIGPCTLNGAMQNALERHTVDHGGVKREGAGSRNEGDSDEIVGGHLARNLLLWKEKQVVRNPVLRRESGKNVESESRGPRGSEYAADGSGRPVRIAGG